MPVEVIALGLPKFPADCSPDTGFLRAALSCWGLPAKSLSAAAMVLSKNGYIPGGPLVEGCCQGGFLLGRDGP